MRLFSRSAISILMQLAAMSLCSHAALASDAAQGPVLRPEMPSEQGTVSARIVRRDAATARRVAAYTWLDKMVAADPELVASICSFSSAAKILARHKHIDRIAEMDHYTCRRITQYRGAAIELVKNPHAVRVVTLDPEGLYVAIRKDRAIVKKLTKNPNFDQMVVQNPDLGRVLASYM